jgi:hypothetical protein
MQVFEHNNFGPKKLQEYSKLLDSDRTYFGKYKKAKIRLSCYILRTG